MSECPIFNISEATSILEEILIEDLFQDKYGNVVDSPELLARIIEYFQNLTERGGLSDKEIDNFTEAIIEVYSDYGLIQSEFYTNPKVIQSTLIRVKDNTYNENSVSVSKLVDTDTEQSVRLATSKFLEDAYGSAVYVKQFAERSFKYNIFNYCFINRFKQASDGKSTIEGLVDNNSDLNRNIIRYLQELVDDIYNYLKSIGYEQFVENHSIYDENFRYSKLSNQTLVIEDLILRAAKFLSPGKYDSLTLADRFRRMAEGDKESALFIRAYNAYVTLRHFDTFLSLSIGKLITINDSNTFNIRTRNKYSLAVKTAANNTTWRTSEVADITKELDKITRLAIETTPLYNYGSTTPSTTDFISFRDFLFIVTRLKKIANTNFAKKFRFTSDIVDLIRSSYDIENMIDSPIKLDLLELTDYIKGKTLSEVISGVSSNPVKNVSYLFELFTNNRFLGLDVIINEKTKEKVTVEDALSEVGIGTFDKKVLWSLYYSVFGISSNTASNITLQKSSRISKANYYEYLTHTVNTIYSPTYILYYRDEDNNITIRNLTDTSLTSDIYNIKTLLNVSMMLKSYELLQEDYDITLSETNGLITKINMTLKDDKYTYKVSVSLLDGAVKIDSRDPNILSVLKIVDKVLGTIYSENPNIVTILKDTDISASTKLLGMLGRAIAIKAVSAKILTDTMTSNRKETLADLAKNLFSDKTKFLKTYKGLDVVHSSSINAVNLLAYAVAKSRGISSIGRVRSGEGNELASTALSRLVDSQEYQIDHFVPITTTKESVGELRPVAGECIIVADRGSVYGGTLKQEDFADIYKATKEAIKFSGQELTYASFMYDYIGGFIATPKGETRQIVGDGYVLLFPCTVSDKPYFPKIIINLNALVEVNGTKKSLRSCSSQEFIEIITREFNTIYNNLANNILVHYKTLFANSTFPSNNKVLLLLFSEFKSDILSSNNILELFSVFNDPKYLELVLDNGLSINSILALNYFIEEYNYNHPNNELTFLEGVHYKAKESTLKADTVFLQYLDMFRDKSKVQQFFDSKLKALVSSMLRTGFSLEGLNTKTDKYAKKLYEFIKSLNAATKRSWSKNVEEISKNEVVYDVVLAKIKFTHNGIEKVFPLFSKTSLYETLSSLYELKPNISYTDENGKVSLVTLLELFTLPNPRIFEIIELNFTNTNIELNPLIYKYNLIDYLFTQEYQISTVGSILGHPGNSDAEKYNAQNKRNVSYTASMYAFELDTLSGISSKTRIAVVDSLKLSLGTIDGSISKVSPWDGGTFVNPFFVYLENYSLGGNKVGITKKPLVHSYNSETGTGTLIKTAGFGITLNWARNSSGIATMLLKMTNMTWFSEDGIFASLEENSYTVDITKSFTGSKINYLLGLVYFRKWDEESQSYKYYLILDIKKLDVLETGKNAGKKVNNTYTRVIQEVDINNHRIGEEIYEKDILVTSNWQLLNLFGGIQSMELSNGKLVTSELAIERVVDACIFVGDVKNKENIKNTKITSQEQVWQPLKHSDIHYLIDKGAIKLGAANINPYSSLFDLSRRLNFYTIDLIQAGILLDKEHHVDNAKVSLMTLVISACAFKGYTVNDALSIYEALNTITNLKIKDFAQAIFGKEEIDIDELRQVVLLSILKSLSNSSNNATFASIIARDLINKVRNGGKITFNDSTFALSDAAIYSKLISSINSFLTKEGIKQHLTGTLSVLSPSHDLIKLYNGKLLENITRSELQEALTRAENNPIFYNSQEGYIDKTYLIELGTTYLITDINGNIENVFVETPEVYMTLKEKVARGEIIKIVKNVIEGSQLSPYNVRFLGDDGKIYLLYDIDEVLWLFKLEFIRREKDPIKRHNLLVDFVSKYSIVDSTLSFILNNLGNIYESDQAYFKRVLRYLHNLTELVLQLFRPDLQYSIYGLYTKAISLVALNPKLEDAKKLLRHKLFIITKGKVDLNRIALYNSISTLDELYLFLATNITPIMETYLKVKINGKYIGINRETINIKPYDIVMAKTFKTKYGLDDKVDLQSILENKNYFLFLYLKTPVVKDSKAYDVTIKRPGKENIYVIDSTSTHDLSDLTLIEPPIYQENGRYYTLDGEEIDYEIPSDAVFYKDTHGNTYILTKNVEKICRDIESSGFYINYKKVPVNLLTKYVENYLAKLEKGNYSFIKAITRNTTEDTIKVLELLENQTISSYKDLTDEQKALLYKLKEYFNIKWVSFKLALEVIAGRTPAQSKLSFMPMRIVAFDNPDINNAYVSTMQLLLQGSDYDIDAVTITTYSINDNGVLLTWSPFTIYDSTATLDASMNLPFPTGQIIKEEFVEGGNTTSLTNFIEEYKDLFTFKVIKLGDKKGLFVSLNLDNTFRDGTLIMSTILKLAKLKSFLENISNVTFCLNNPELTEWVKLNITKGEIVSDGITYILKYFILIANRHNTYLSRLSSKLIDNALNNLAVHNILKVSKNPGDLLEAQVGLDNCTAPLDAEADANLEEKLYFANSGPGNFLGKIEAFLNNLIGKECVGIAANGLKIFAAITTYMNRILNYGNLEEQLMLKSEFSFKELNYKLIADVKSLDINTIQDLEILEELARVAETDSDAALSLSALLSLAVDNAKNLKLAKINASQTMLPLYIFGVTMGISIPELVKVLNSRTGRIISGLILGNIFTYNNPIKNIGLAVSLLAAKGIGSARIINSYFYSRGEIVYLDTLNNVAKEVLSKYGLEIKDSFTFGDIICNIIEAIEEENNVNYNIILEIVSKLNLNPKLKTARLLLLDIYTAKTDKTLSSISNLANGAKECRLLGQFLSLNLGIPNAPLDLYLLVESFETCTMTKADPVRINLRQFVYDDNYRKEAINLYLKKMVAVNILAVLANNPQYMGYLKALASAHEAAKATFVYRTISRNIGGVYTELRTNLSNKTLKDRIYKGYLRAILLKIVSTFLLLESPILYPANTIIYRPLGAEIRQIKSPISLELQLGTDTGNATFKKWMEELVIPDLKRGFIGTDLIFDNLKANPFITDLSASIVTNTPLRNPTIVHSLPINMLPRDEVESMNLDKYRLAFAELATYKYTYTTTEVIDGRLVNTTKSIPILDLFAYYTLIVYNWQQSSKSLLQLFSQIYNLGIASKFTDFIKVLDAVGVINPEGDQVGLILDFEKDVLPNVVFSENPYLTTSKYLLVYNNQSDLNEIYVSTLKEEENDEIPEEVREMLGELDIDMDFLGEQSIADIVGEEFESERNTIPFTPLSSINNLYADSVNFPLGYSRESINDKLLLKVTKAGKDIELPITFTSTSKTSVKLSVDSIIENSTELNKALKDIELPLETVDNIDTINITDAVAIINHIINPC